MYRNRHIPGFFCSLPARFAFLFFAFVLVLPAMAYALQVTLKWDDNSESDIAGYKVFLRQESGIYNYFHPTWEGIETTCTVSDLGENTRYYFVVRTYNTSGQQSGNSNEVTYGVKFPHDASEEIVGTWRNGIWFWDNASSLWARMHSSVPSGAIAAGDFSGDGRADVASIWGTGLWYQDGATLGWTRVCQEPPDRIAAGDITGDGQDEIIGCGGDWGSGVWYRDVFKGTWHRPWNDTPDGAIAAGDVTGDGKTDIISCWSDGLWYQDGATLGRTKVYDTAPYKVTAGDVTGDGQAEIIGPWSNGIWYWDVAESKWTKMTSYTTSKEIAAGDFTGDGRADVASVWSTGLWYQDGATLGWTRVYHIAPDRIAAGDITKN